MLISGIMCKYSLLNIVIHSLVIVLICHICNALLNREALFLTPLIECGEISKAQSLSRVRHSQFQNVESYSGYITVNKTYYSNLFFWYFPAETNSASAPVILWLNGGPGTSSLLGIFTENGPFYVTERNVRKRKYYWSRNHNVIYIDNPVGTGFSFTENEAGYARNQEDVGRDLYNCLVQFFQLFPSLQKNDFYATGESYAGKYVPAISYFIHQNNADAKVKINLKGLSIGNGNCDPPHQYGYSDYLYQIGLIDDKYREIFHRYELVVQDKISKEDYVGARDTYFEMTYGNATSPPTLFANITGFHYYYNYLHTQGNSQNVYIENFARREDVRQAIHVGEHSFETITQKVQEHLAADVMKTVAPWISELLSHYRCLFYNGQLDITIPYHFTVNVLRNLKFSGKEEFMNAERRIWKVNEEVAGYAKVAANLTEILVRNAGHMVPKDQPLWAWDLITRFTSGTPF